MEDTYIAEKLPQGHLFCVFDGHGGDEASQYMADNFAKYFDKQASCLSAAFNRAANYLKDYPSGTTASVAFIPTNSRVVYTAVVGDSPIIIDTPQGYWFGPDHNVRTNLEERAAAEARGGHYSSGYIFRGNSGDGLQMGRALGDASLAPVISAEPEISVVTARNFILIGSDGLFDPAHHDFKVSAEAVLTRISCGDDAQGLVDRALSIPTRDNVTAILVRF
jgi:serine/threonine protein phosphatase PrpC